MTNLGESTQRTADNTISKRTDDGDERKNGNDALSEDAGKERAGDTEEHGMWNAGEKDKDNRECQQLGNDEMNGKTLPIGRGRRTAHELTKMQPQAAVAKASESDAEEH